jgi:hypothetical protein
MSFTHEQLNIIKLEGVARVVDPAPFGRQDKNWNGKDSPLWEHHHNTDVCRIATALNRAQSILDFLQSCQKD